jgi:hypothetical protein
MESSVLLQQLEGSPPTRMDISIPEGLLLINLCTIDVMILFLRAPYITNTGGPWHITDLYKSKYRTTHTRFHCI